MLCCSTCLSSKGRNASTKRHNTDSIELEDKSATWKSWSFHVSESTGKEGSFYIGWCDWSWLLRGSWAVLHNRVRKNMSVIQKIPQGIYLLSSSVIKVKKTTIQFTSQWKNHKTIISGSDSLGMKVWVTFPGKEPEGAEVPAWGQRK